MEKEQADGKPKTRRRRKLARIPRDTIAPDYFPSDLPGRDMEVPNVVTVYTVMDYLRLEMAMPREPKFAGNIDVVPIPREKNFADNPSEIAAFLERLEQQTDEAPAPYVLSTVEIPDTGNFFLVQLRERYFPQIPARVVLLPQDANRRTFGLFTTEKVLADSSVPIQNPSAEKSL